MLTIDYQCRARPCIQNNIREFRRDRTRRRGDCVHVHDIFNDEDILKENVQNFLVLQCNDILSLESGLQ